MHKGIYLPVNDRPGGRAYALSIAKEVEERGFAGIASSTRGDNLAWLLAVLDRTERIGVMTHIANIYLRHSSMMGHAASLIEELHPGRFVLGLGVSHGPVHQSMNLSAGRPLSDMRDYVEGIREVAEGAPMPPVILATLRRRMVRLAGEIASGAIWANAVHSHLAESLQEVPDERRPDFIVGDVVLACVSDDRAAAAAKVRRALRYTFTSPNYANYFIEAGFEADVEAARDASTRGDEQGMLNAISDRFLEETALVGSAAEVREGAQRWLDSGVTHLVVSPLAPPGGGDAMRSALDTFGQ